MGQINSNPKIIMGLYEYIRYGLFNKARYQKTIEEIKSFLGINRNIDREGIVFLAGDNQSSTVLENFGLTMDRVFEDAPDYIKHNKGHLMKLYMILWAVKKYKEVLWVDWDNIVLKWPDESFWKLCRSHNTPKFIYIANYWATVNCGVCYINSSWANKLKNWESFEIEDPNDELVWRPILPKNVEKRNEFWFGSRAVNIWSPSDVNLIKKDTYFAHIKTFSFYPLVIKRFVEVNK